MNSKRRTTPARGFAIASHPVGRAVLLNRMVSALRTERIATLMMEDGEPATEHLAHLGWMLAVGCETAAAALGLQHPTTRTLHGAMRSIEAMCLRNGYRWQADQAVPLQEALASALEMVTTYARVAQHHTDAGHLFAHVIRRHELQPGMVAGAELYAQAQPQEA